MKIEMGESLGASWMRHVKHCSVVQSNWKPSPLTEISHRKEIEKLFRGASEIFKGFGVDIFKKNASVEQLLRQTECDVMGVVIAGGHVSFHTLEVAFHEQGLQYGSKEETAAKVAAKLARTAFCLYAFADQKGGDVSFASPKVNPATLKEIKEVVELVEKFFKEAGLGYQFHLYLNDDFCKEIMKPVIDLRGVVSDTNELFLRGVQLMALCADSAKQETVRNPKKHGKAAANGQDNEKPNESTGDYVRRVLIPVLPGLTAAEVDELCDKDWCKHTFDLNYPLLVADGSDYPRERYWMKAKDTVTISDQIYHITNDWYPRNRGPLDAWLATKVPDDTNLR